MWTLGSSKITNCFSAMPIDQCNEQNNEIVKVLGGAIGLTENPSAFCKWMMAGPEQVRLLNEFESDIFQVPDNQFHHKEGIWVQNHLKNKQIA